MSNSYYTHTTYPPTNSSGASAPMRSELDALMSGFDLLPNPLGIGQKGFTGGSWTNPVITGGSLDNITLGATARNTARTTTLDASGAVTFGAGGSLTGTYTAIAAAILSGFAITGGSINNAPIGGTTRSTAQFTTIDTTGAVHVGGNLSIDGALTTKVASFELGNPAAAAASFVDFHSSGASSDFDGRILVSGGNASAGNGAMSYTAASHTFNARPTWAGLTPWDNSNLADPVRASSANFTNTVQLASGGVTSTYMRFNTNNGYGPYLRAWNGAGRGGAFEMINSANTSINAQFFDDGYVNFPRNGGNFALRPTWQGFFPWDSGNFNPALYLALTGGTLSGGVNSVAGGDPNGFQGSLGPGYLKLNEFNYGGYLDFSRTRGEDFKWRIHYDFPTGYLQFLANGGGYVEYRYGDGNIFSSGFGWVWDEINNAKANANGRAPGGATCNWNAGVTEIAAVAVGGGNIKSDAPAPYVMIGLRTVNGGPTWVWPHITFLRNQ